MKKMYIFSACRAFLLMALLYFSSGVYAQTSFNYTTLKRPDGTIFNINNPTSLQFGPDKRLYVSTQGGAIQVLTITNAGSNEYTVTHTEFIDLVLKIPNHDDDGKLAAKINSRQITGLLVAGTASNPMIYVSSSDPRIGGGGGGADKNLDTNSGIISLLTKTSNGWEKVDLVRGLPRSEENHANNGMQLDKERNILYVAQGGNTNAGAPSNNFAFLTEFALSAAILSIDLNEINQLPTRTDANGQKYKYDLPTLDDPTRPNLEDGSDPGDPFGGNDGLNQAKLVEGGPVQVYASGFRNAYDLVITKTSGREGKIYAVDNGANGGWGGHPANEGSHGNVTNDYVVGEPGSSTPGPNDDKVNNKDGLHLITKGYYGGHPNPVRANPTGAGLYTFGTEGVWRTSKSHPDYPLPADWPPVPASMANPIEGDFRNPGPDNGALYLWHISTNGIAEYTASNFNNAMKGNLITTSWDGHVYKVVLNNDGTKVTSVQSLASGLNFPLDVTAQADDAIFPGTIWTTLYGEKSIAILEPLDYVNCEGQYALNLDDDGDRYSNADEIDNGTNPCSPASKPADFDGDFISNLNDPDDDNDNLPDTEDFFAWDADNGRKTNLPIDYPLLNNDPGTGFFGLGFTGLMSNGKTDYLDAYDEDLLIAGGAVGALTVDGATDGDAYKSNNNQENAFQFGIHVNSNTGPFTASSTLLSPFFNNEKPVDHQSQGMYIGTGDQDNYLKIALVANGGKGGLQVLFESAGAVKSELVYAADKSGAQLIADDVLAATTINLLLTVDPVAGKVQPKYQVNGGTHKNLGAPIQLEGKLLDAVKNEPALAVGLMASSRGSGKPFTATWDHISVTSDGTQTAEGTWRTITTATNPEARHENSFVQVGNKFYLLGGRGNKNIGIYNTTNNTWTTGAKPPVEIHHFQALEYHGLIYVVGAFTGTYPGEKPLSNIYIYNPVTDTWTTGPEIPEARRRGSAGAFVYKDKIYLLAGATNGHTSGHVKWFDEYDPATNTWKILPDAPRARDHFHAVVANNKAYAVGGRLSKSAENVFANTIAEVDVYDFSNGSWSTLPAAQNLPTPRAAAAIAVLGNEILVIGGESAAQNNAHSETEALNFSTHTWRSLAPLNQGRHGTQAIVSNSGVYVAAGNKTRGGGNELNSMEAFHMHEQTQPGGTAVAEGTFNAPASLAIGTVKVNQTATKHMTVGITGGNQGMLVTAVSITGSQDFKVKNPYQLPFLIKPGQVVDFEVSFQSSSAGDKSATLAIQHTGSKSKANVELTATVQQVASLTLNSATMHFLSQEAGSVSPPQDVIIQNQGQAAVNIEKVGITGVNSDQFRHNFTPVVTIQPGASYTIKVNFAPKNQGLKQATLTITPSDGLEALTVKLSGEGIDSVVTSASSATAIKPSGYTLYPNPVGNKLQIEFYGANNKVEAIEIFDLLGKKYLELIPEIKNNILEVDVAGLNMNAGVYFIQIKTADYQRTSKFIKD